MTSLLKQALPLLLIPFFISCTSDPFSAKQVKPLIRAQITAHYDSLQLEGYQPLSYSIIDTIAVQRSQDGNILAIIGEVTHRYKAIQGDSLQEQNQAFYVQIYEDDVIVLLPKDNSEKNEQPSISI